MHNPQIEIELSEKDAVLLAAHLRVKREDLDRALVTRWAVVCLWSEIHRLRENCARRRTPEGPIVVRFRVPKTPATVALLAAWFRWREKARHLTASALTLTRTWYKKAVANGTGAPRARKEREK